MAVMIFGNHLDHLPPMFMQDPTQWVYATHRPTAQFGVHTPKEGAHVHTTRHCHMAPCIRKVMISADIQTLPNTATITTPQGHGGP